MKWMLFLLLAMSASLRAQSTFSRTYDMMHDAPRNYLRDLVIEDERIVMLTGQLCDADSLYRECGMLSLFDTKGDVLDQEINVELNTIVGGMNAVRKLDNHILQASTTWGDRQTKTHLLAYNWDLELIQHTEYPGSDGADAMLNEGLFIQGDHLYIYGNASGGRLQDTLQIIKTRSNGEVVWMKNYSFGGTSDLYIQDLQATADGHLAFIVQAYSPEGPNNGFDGNYVVKIDTAGEVIRSFAFEDQMTSLSGHSGLLCTADGGYVFGSDLHPFDGIDIFTTGYGLINKLDPDMDTLMWSLVLPNDQFTDGRNYSIVDYIETADGDIVACGSVYDNSDSEAPGGGPDLHSTWNGFLLRLSPEGDIRWLRLYRQPNDILPVDIYGDYAPSSLTKVRALDDGRFLLGGHAYYNNYQRSAIDERETEVLRIWLMMVDQKGCLVGYDCEETIRFNQPYRYHIGDEWIYETEFSIGGSNVSIGYTSYQVTDTILSLDRTRYVLSTGDTFYVDQGRMYFWDDDFESYVMHYDWQEDSAYTIAYYDQFRASEEVAVVIIDSISYTYFGTDSILVQHVRIQNGGNIEGDETAVIYAGVGTGQDGVKLRLGCGLCDPVTAVTKLRCFIQDTMTYHFVPYACDSTWMFSSTYAQPGASLSLYPNPTQHQVVLSGVDGDVLYELYTSDGRLVHRGMTAGKTFSLPQAGIFMARFLIEDHWVAKKVVKVD